jgi:hypothetical protein
MNVLCRVCIDDQTLRTYLVMATQLQAGPNRIYRVGQNHQFTVYVLCTINFAGTSSNIRSYTAHIFTCQPCACTRRVRVGKCMQDYTIAPQSVQWQNPQMRVCVCSVTSETYHSHLLRYISEVLHHWQASALACQWCVRPSIRTSTSLALTKSSFGFGGTLFRRKEVIEPGKREYIWIAR